MAASLRYPMQLLAAAALLSLAPPGAYAASTASPEVACKLPGQIRSIGGHSVMGAGRIVQTSPEDCRQRGGEYTVPTPPPAPAVAAASPASSGPLVSCRLPAQTRQLGEKARYRTVRRVVRITRGDCAQRGGNVVVIRKARPVRKKT